MARFRRRRGEAVALPKEHQTTIFERLETLARCAETSDPTQPAVRLFCIVLGLMGLGLLLQASHAATICAKTADFRAEVFQQAIFRVIAIGVLILGYRIGPRRLRPLLPGLVLLAAALLVCCWVPGLEFSAHGAHRWVVVPGTSITIQPSELARVALVLWVADRCTRLGPRLLEVRRGVLPILAVGMVFFVLIGTETDLGGSLVFLSVFLFTWFVGGASFTHFTGSLATLCGAAMVLAVSSVEYIRSRIEVFLGIVENAQVKRSLEALGSGDLYGVGLGRGLFRNTGLPYQDSDFVFALVGEELGFLGVALCTVLMILFLWFSLRLALSIRDRFSALAAFGLLLSVGLQAMIHMQVVTNLAPPKGMTLPFVSDGGTSLIVSSLAVGLAIGAARDQRKTGETHVA